MSTSEIQITSAEVVPYAEGNRIKATYIAYGETRNWYSQVITTLDGESFTPGVEGDGVTINLEEVAEEIAGL